MSELFERAFAGLPPAVAHRQHFREKHTTCPFAPLRGHYLVRTISGVRMLGCAIPFRCSSGGWDDEPAATLDGARATVAVGYSRDGGCRLARCLRACRNPE